MKNDCTNWKDQLLEAALGGQPTGELERHLLACAACSQKLAELQTRRQSMDQLLPQLTRAESPSESFPARVLAAATADETRKPESRKLKMTRFWELAAVAATLAIAVTLGLLMVLRHKAGPFSPEDLRAAQQLAEWRAPSDVLLQTPASHALLAPRLSESYIKLPIEKKQEPPK